MAAFPDTEELKGFVTVDKVFAWVPLPEALATLVLEPFGMASNEPVRNFAALPQDVFETTLAGMKVEGVPLLPAPRTKVIKAYEVSKMAAG